jgi:hypothetical protein
MTKGPVTLLAPQALAASASVSTVLLDASARFEAQVQVTGTFGTVAGTNGLQVQVFPAIGSTPAYDTIPAATMVIPGTASTTQTQTLKLPTGLYQLRLTNLDGTNPLSNVGVTWASIDSVQ